MTDDTQNKVRALCRAIHRLAHPDEELSRDEQEHRARILIAAALPPDSTPVDPAQATEQDVQDAFQAVLYFEGIRELGDDEDELGCVLYDRYEARHQATEAWLDEVAELGWAGREARREHIKAGLPALIKAFAVALAVGGCEQDGGAA